MGFYTRETNREISQEKERYEVSGSLAISSRCRCAHLSRVKKRAFTAPASFTSISAAFKNPHGKSTPNLQTTIFPVHATKPADRRPYLLIQIRPSSSETLLPNFLRSESPKKTVDKEAQTQVR